MYYNNKKLALSIFWVLLGGTLMALTILRVLDDNLYSGMGGALMVVGVLQIVRNVNYRRDPAYREKVDTEARDERNRFLRMKSWSWAGYIAILVQGVGAAVAMALGQRVVQLTLSYSVCLLLVVYWVAYVVLGRKY